MLKSSSTPKYPNQTIRKINQTARPKTKKAAARSRAAAMIETLVIISLGLLLFLLGIGIVLRPELVDGAKCQVGVLVWHLQPACPSNLSGLDAEIVEVQTSRMGAAANSEIVSMNIVVFKDGVPDPTAVIQPDAQMVSYPGPHGGQMFYGNIGIGHSITFSIQDGDDVIAKTWN